MANRQHSNRLPFSGGAKAALSSRGADTLARAVARLSAAARSATRR